MCVYTYMFILFSHSTVLTWQPFLPQQMRNQTPFLQSTEWKLSGAPRLEQVHFFGPYCYLPCDNLHFHFHTFVPISSPTFAFHIKYSYVNSGRNFLSLFRGLTLLFISVPSYCRLILFCVFFVSSYLYACGKKTLTIWFYKEYKSKA